MATITTGSQPTTSSSFKRLITRYPLLAQNGLLPYTIPDVGPYPVSYYFAALSAIAGPTLASLTVTAITTGKAGVRQLESGRNILHVVGKSKQAKGLVNLAVVSYTEQWSTLAPAVFPLEEEEQHAHRERRTTPSCRDWEYEQTVPVLFESRSLLSPHSLG